MAASDITVMIDEGGPIMTRARLLSKSKALTSSRSVVKSYLGSAVIRNSTTENVVHQLNLRRLQLENDWRLRQLDNDLKLFRSRRERLPDPLLVVDRPPTSPVYYETVSSPRRGVVGEGGEHVYSMVNGRPKQHQLPGYMRPTTRTTRSLPLIPTIDAFRRLNTKNMLGTKTTSVSRTGNGKTNVRFRSAVLPSWPLSDAEQLELRAHWQQHCEQLAYNRRRQKSESNHQHGPANNQLQRRWTYEQPDVDKISATNELLSTGNVVEHDVVAREASQRPLLLRRNTTGADGYSGQNVDKKVDSYLQEHVTTDVEVTVGNTDGLTDLIRASNSQGSERF